MKKIATENIIDVAAVEIVEPKVVETNKANKVLMAIVIILVLAIAFLSGVNKQLEDKNAVVVQNATELLAAKKAADSAIEELRTQNDLLKKQIENDEGFFDWLKKAMP